MKVHIGPYRRWIGAYQIVDMFFFWHPKHVFDDAILERWDYKLKDKIGDWLAESWVHKFCQWIDSKKKRKVNVRIDPYDTWSMDHTLALIIHPMLVQLKNTKHGSACVDVEDTPTIEVGELDDFGSDNKVHERWDWVLDEMIWSFEQIINDNSHELFYNEDTQSWDREALDKYEERIKNGLRLFGKYYRGLWD
jgi:hypothetical protein